jgi:hypothetical protein
MGPTNGTSVWFILPLEALRLDPQQQCTDCCQLAHVLPKETVVANVAEAVYTVLLLLLSRVSFHHLIDSSTDLLGSLGSSNWDNGVALRAGQTIICKDPRSTTSVADPVLLLWRDALQLPSPGSVGGVVAAVSRNFGLSTTTDSSRKDSGIAVASEDLERLIVFVRITLRDDDVSGCTKLLGAAVAPLLSGWWGG